MLGIGSAPKQSRAAHVYVNAPVTVYSCCKVRENNTKHVSWFKHNHKRIKTAVVQEE